MARKNKSDNFDMIRLNSPLLMQLLLSNYTCVNNDKVKFFQIDDNTLYYNADKLLKIKISESIQQLGYTLLNDCFICDNIDYWYNVWFVSQYISDHPNCQIDIKPEKLDFMKKVLLIASQLDNTHSDLKDYCHKYISTEMQELVTNGNEFSFTEKKKLSKVTDIDSIMSNFYCAFQTTTQNQMNKLLTNFKVKGNNFNYVILLINIITHMDDMLYTFMIQAPAWTELYSKTPLRILSYKVKNQTLEQYIDEVNKGEEESSKIVDETNNFGDGRLISNQQFNNVD